MHFQWHTQYTTLIPCLFSRHVSRMTCIVRCSDLTKQLICVRFSLRQSSKLRNAQQKIQSKNNCFVIFILSTRRQSNFCFPGFPFLRSECTIIFKRGCRTPWFSVTESRSLSVGSFPSNTVCVRDFLLQSGIKSGEDDLRALMWSVSGWLAHQGSAGCCLFRADAPPHQGIPPIMLHIYIPESHSLHDLVLCRLYSFSRASHKVIVFTLY